MKSLITCAAAAAACLAPALAQAQTQTSGHTGVYGGVGYSHLDGQGVDLGALEGRLGYRFNNWFGVEGELGVGVKDDERRTALGGQIDYELEYKGALYAVAFLPVSPNTDVFARAGYGTTKVEHSATVAGHDKAESWNFGVGAQHHFDGVNGVRVDYTRQERDDAAGGGHADVWSVGYTRRF